MPREYRKTTRSKKISSKTSSEKLLLAKERALMLKRIRDFFSKKNILEITAPCLIPFPTIDLHIETMQTIPLESEVGFLHTSPEYAMKRLLAMGFSAIYFLGPVFRKGELGSFHHPEFTMAEWYRREISFEKFVDEVYEFFFLFLGKVKRERLSYREAFLRFAKIDPFTATTEELLHTIASFDLLLPKEPSWDRDSLLHLLMSHIIEPKMEKEVLYCIQDFPPSQASLARLCKKEGQEIAERFEIYFNSVELANGFHELADAKEQRRRFEETNALRKAQGKEILPLDGSFLSALENGIGDCCGVAMGVDRLFMLLHKKTTLKEVLLFPWGNTPKAT